MKELIKERIKLKNQKLKLKMQNEYRLKKQIQRIDVITKQLYEIVAGMNLIVEEYAKDSYKEKYKLEHQKFKEYEKESKQIIEELTEELKKVSK